jgi:cytochrome c-type biogenesis protein CcmH/NrfG
MGQASSFDGACMAIIAKSSTTFRSLSIGFLNFLAFIAVFSGVAASQQTLGSIVGKVRVVRGDTPPERILVSLDLHGSPLDSVYTDSQGTFGFHSLQPEGYEVTINDEQYQPVRMTAEIHPNSLAPTVFLDIQLVPKSKATDAAPRQHGSNPNIMDIREYSKDLPPKAVKEFKRGVESDQDNKKDEAIAHYRKALEIAPNYYPAHNNLGTLFLGKSDFKSAEEQFQEAVRLDPSEAQAYFNLSNVLMLTKRFADAEITLAQGLQRRPDSAFGNFLQGCLYYQTGMPAEAERSLQNALRLDPKMLQAHLQLVNLYLQQNRRPDAIKQLQAFLQNFPNAPAAPKAKEILNKLQTEEAAKR